MKKTALKTAIGTVIGARVIEGIGGPASANVAQGFTAFSAGFPAIGTALGGIEVLKATKQLSKIATKHKY